MFLINLLALLLIAPLPASASVELERPDELRAFGWYQWVCQAWAPGYDQPFQGTSFYFQGWFDESREARNVAYQNALSYCEFYTERECFSRMARDCRLHQD